LFKKKVKLSKEEKEEIFNIKKEIFFKKIKPSESVCRKIKKKKLWLLFDFIKWKLIDIYRAIRYGRKFIEYGLTMYCGRQGAGKTMAIVEYLERMKIKYPDAVIVTNFGYLGQNRAMDSWQDFLEIRNGEDGVIFAIDELQNEYDSSKWNTFPEGLLSQVTQQRKQKVKIVASSQVYTRVVKQLREQCFQVVECRTLAGRWTFTRCFDAQDYNTVIDNPEKKQKLSREWRKSFVQSDDLRDLYDSYAVIEKMRDIDFIPRHQRSAG